MLFECSLPKHARTTAITSKWSWKGEGRKEWNEMKLGHTLNISTGVSQALLGPESYISFRVW